MSREEITFLQRLGDPLDFSLADARFALNAIGVKVVDREMLPAFLFASPSNAWTPGFMVPGDVSLALWFPRAILIAGGPMAYVDELPLSGFVMAESRTLRERLLGKATIMTLAADSPGSEPFVFMVALPPSVQYKAVGDRIVQAIDTARMEAGLPKSLRLSGRLKRLLRMP